MMKLLALLLVAAHSPAFAMPAMKNPPSGAPLAHSPLVQADLTSAAVDASNLTFLDMLVVLNAILIYFACLNGQSCAPNTSLDDMQTYFGSVINEYRSGQDL